jgi:tripartite-type tricarboxylate transporter receptor subunit TctC
MTMRSWIRLAAVLLMFAIAPMASSQPPVFPSKPVTLIVPFAPGGITDGLARLIATKLSEKWKQSVIVENKAGGGTIIGTQLVAKAGADGHMLLLTSFGYITNQILVKDLPYDPKSLAAISLVGISPNVLYLHPTVPVSNVAGLIEYAKANPGKLMFASSGNVTSPHIAAELFGSLTGTSVVHVPYRGTGPAMNDVLGGQVSGIFDTMQSMPYAKAGKLKAIAVTAERRLLNAPDVPTFKEAGLPGMVIASWFGFFLPAVTPESTQNQVFNDIRDVVTQPDMRAKIIQLGVEPFDGGRRDFQAFLDAELPRWTALIKARGIKLD